MDDGLAPPAFRCPSFGLRRGSAKDGRILIYGGAIKNVCKLLKTRDGR